MTQIYNSSFQACVISMDRYISTPEISVEVKITIGSSLLLMGINPPVILVKLTSQSGCEGPQSFQTT